MRIDGQLKLGSLAAVYAPIAADLADSQRLLVDELSSDQPSVRDLCGHISRFHGKMLRPGVLLLCAKACREVRPAHRLLAAVVELVHVAALVHDDVLDDADIRRRAATVNRLWGNGHAVLIGDFLYSHAFRLCSHLGSPYASRLIGQTAIAVCEGEMMQVANRGNYQLTEAQYLDIIGRKTAALVETCCHLGAVYADADRDTVTRLAGFGRNLGMAFQIVDDLLDLLGDEWEVGKSLGRDVHKGELTLPLIHYLRTAPAGQCRRLLSIMGGEDPGRYREIAELLRGSESVAYAQAVARQHIKAACDALACLPPSSARDSLRDLAQFVIARRQ